MNDNLHNFQKCHILNLTSECDGHSTWRSCWQHLRLYVTKRLHEILHIFYNIFHILDDYAGRKNLKMQIQIWKWPKIANFCSTSRLYSYHNGTNTQYEIIPEILPFLLWFSRRNWRVIFEVFHSNFGLASLNWTVTCIVCRNEQKIWELFTSSLRSHI